MTVSVRQEDTAYYLAVNTLEGTAHNRTPGWDIVATNDQFPAEKAHAKVMALFGENP